MMRFVTLLMLAASFLWLAPALHGAAAHAQQETVVQDAPETAAPGTRAATIAYDAALEADGDSTIVRLKFDGKPDYRLFFMDNPVRLVLETDGASFALPDRFAESTEGLVTQVRFGSVTRERSRLVLSLSSPSEINDKKLVHDQETGRFELDLAIAAIDAETFRTRVAEQAALLGTSGEAVVKGGRVRSAPKREGYFTIVLDPGHGGIDGGSEGRHLDVAEKEITLAVARKLGPLLEAAGPFHVVFTRTEDVFISLRERQAVAQRENADLMISIHADSLRQSFVRGATVYTLADRASDALAQQVADSENLADVVAGLAAPEESDVVADILADLTLRETTHFSRAFANMLVRKMTDRMELINNPHRSASFAVLKNAEVPSVLLELGYLSNIEDEKLMTDPAWQERAAKVVSDAVMAFFSGRTSGLKAN